MGNRRRLARHKQRGMKKRLINGKKPMSKEQKEANKIARETQSTAQKKMNEAAKTKK